MNFREFLGYFALVELQILCRISAEFVNATNLTVQPPSDANVTWIKITTIEPADYDKGCENCTSVEYEEQNPSPSSRRKRRKRRRNKKPTMSDRSHKIWNQRRKMYEYSHKRYSTRVRLEKPVKFLEAPGQDNEISKIDADLKPIQVETTSRIPKGIPPPVRYLLPPFVNQYYIGNAAASELSKKNPTRYESSANARGLTKFKNTIFYRENEIDYTTLIGTEYVENPNNPKTTNKPEFKPIVVRPTEAYEVENVTNPRNFSIHRNKSNFVSPEVAKAGMKVLNMTSEFQDRTIIQSYQQQVNHDKTDDRPFTQQETSYEKPYAQFREKSPLTENNHESRLDDQRRKPSTQLFQEQSVTEQGNRLEEQQYQSRQQYQEQPPLVQNDQSLSVLPQEHQQKPNQQEHWPQAFTERDHKLPVYQQFQEQSSTTQSYQISLQEHQQRQQNQQLQEQLPVTQNYQRGQWLDHQRKPNNPQFQEQQRITGDYETVQQQKVNNHHQEQQPIIRNYQQIKSLEHQQKSSDPQYDEASFLKQNYKQVQQQEYLVKSNYQKFQQQPQATQNYGHSHVRNHQQVSEPEHTTPVQRYNELPHENYRQQTVRQMEMQTTPESIQYTTNNSLPLNKKKSSKGFKGLELAESSYFSDLPTQQEVSSLLQNDGQVIPGMAGKDYPTFSQSFLQRRRFACRGLEGYFADISSRCQVFYICNGVGAGEPMLCPNGTLFSQELLVCDWWYNVDC